MKIIKGQTAVSVTVLAAVAMLGRTSRKFSLRTDRFLVWISRSKHVTFILGRQPSRAEVCNAKEFIDTLWYLGWWVTPSSTSFSGMMRDRDAYGGFARSVLEQTWEHLPQSRESVWATIRHWTFFPLADVRKTSLLRPRSSTFPFAPSQNLHGSLHLLCLSLHLSSLSQC